ncbi:MAG TPA: dihydrofolate reductase family protein [Candidatus Acidoferrum sp.]|nr:dihydrofolate reductase family protein [Candidatus Acidoferrum sp.]
MFQRRELPFVFMNGAVSADGKLALENRSLIQFSSKRDQNFVLQLRATADAVLCGAETVEIFSIDLGADSVACRKKRERKGLPSEPLRVLVSDDGNLDPSARVFQQKLSPVLVLVAERGYKRCAIRLRGKATVKSFGKSSVDFVRAFRWLREEFGVKRLLCEGGGETNAALITAGVVDEVHITICPLILRGRNAPTICDGDGARSLKSATRLKLKTVTVVKGELFLTYSVLGKASRKTPGR